MWFKKTALATCSDTGVLDKWSQHGNSTLNTVQGSKKNILLKPEQGETTVRDSVWIVRDSDICVFGYSTVVGHTSTDETTESRHRVVFSPDSVTKKNQLVPGFAFVILRAVSDQHGYEAWRRLCAQYEPTTSTRTTGMSQALISPDLEEQLVGVMGVLVAPVGSGSVPVRKRVRKTISNGNPCVCGAEQSTNSDSGTATNANW
eukprot:3205827-Amphidinium_carterae.1